MMNQTVERQEIIGRGLDSLPDCRQCRQTWHTATNVSKLYRSPFTRSEKQVMGYWATKLSEHIKINHGTETERNGSE